MFQPEPKNELRGVKMGAKRPELEVLPPSEIYSIITGSEDKRLQALASLLYLTGCRISEAEEFQPRNITDKGDIVVFKMLNLKARAPSRRWKNIPVPIKEPKAKCMEDKFFAILSDFLKGVDIFGKPFRFWLRTNFTRKNKKGAVREYSRSNLHKYIGRLKLRTVAFYPNGEQKIIEKPLNPHYLRHARHTHLWKYYGVQPFDMMFFAGWSDIQMAMEYVHADSIQLEKVFNDGKV